MPDQPSPTREILERFAQTPPHHAFRLKSGEWREGFISEIGDNSLLFSPAPSPFDDSNAWMQEREIAFNEIDINSLQWP